jgi:hypothetical protein
VLDVGGAADIGDGTQHIGERAIPAFLEGFHGDDEFNRARRIEQIMLVQLALLAGGDGDLVLARCSRCRSGKFSGLRR